MAPMMPPGASSPVHDSPTASFHCQIDGDWRFDSKRGAMVWTIDLIDDSNRTGSMEFVVSAADAEAFYPIEVRGPSDEQGFKGDI